MSHQSGESFLRSGCLALPVTAKVSRETVTFTPFLPQPLCARGPPLAPLRRLSTSIPRKPIMPNMTKLLDKALEAVRLLPAEDQDEIALVIMQLAGSDFPASVPLSPEEREAIRRSKGAAKRDEFATDEQVRAVWAKHGL